MAIDFQFYVLCVPGKIITHGKMSDQEFHLTLRELQKSYPSLYYNSFDNENDYINFVNQFHSVGME